MCAGIAFSAGDLRLQHDLLSRREAGHGAADFDDLTGDLMALGHGIFGVGVFAVIDVDVRAADAETHHFHKDLVFFDLRDGDILKFDHAGGSHHFLQHSFKSPFARFA